MPPAIDSSTSLSSDYRDQFHLAFYRGNELRIYHYAKGEETDKIKELCAALQVIAHIDDKLANQRSPKSGSPDNLLSGCRDRIVGRGTGSHPRMGALSGGSCALRTPGQRVVRLPRKFRIHPPLPLDGQVVAR